jgi:hypothetical protein
VTTIANHPRTTVRTYRGRHGSPGTRRALALAIARTGDTRAAILAVLSEGAR